MWCWATTSAFALPHAVKMKYLEEMALVAEAVCRVYQPDKMNYELLENGDTHVHWHLFPRVAGDTPERGPVWWLPKEELWNDAFRPSKEELKRRTQELRAEIEGMLDACREESIWSN